MGQHSLVEMVRQLFASAGGSNFYDHHPLSFKITGIQAEQDPLILRQSYLKIFAQIAQTAFGQPYQFSEVPIYKRPEAKWIAVHPTSMRVHRAKHDYYSNQLAFLYEGGGDFPIIDVTSYDFRRPEKSKDETSLFLRFTYGSRENRETLFAQFEEFIRQSGIKYERHHTEIAKVDSLHYQISFKDAVPKDEDLRVAEVATLMDGVRTQILLDLPTDEKIH